MSRCLNCDMAIPSTEDFCSERCHRIHMGLSPEPALYMEPANLHVDPAPDIPTPPLNRPLRLWEPEPRWGPTVALTIVIVVVAVVCYYLGRLTDDMPIW